MYITIFKEINVDAAKSFWTWFEEQEIWIIDCISKHDAAFVWAIDERLKPVFPYFKGELEFQLGSTMALENFLFPFREKGVYSRCENAWRIDAIISGEKLEGYLRKINISSFCVLRHRQ